MCTHQRLIYPKYTRFPLYVKCGKFPACLQEKAARRVKRIHDTNAPSLACYMVALTYSRGTAPYIFRDDAYKFSKGEISNLYVWRDSIFRKVRKPSNYNDYNQVNKRLNYPCLLDSIDFIKESSLKNTKDLKHEFGKIGVVYYPDYQHFIARFRLNLKRHYNYEGRIFIYACDEYGCRSFRPHFHLLIFAESNAESIIRSAVFESWPFSNLARFPRAFERSFKSASYVASYVNQSSKFPTFFRDYFKTKHSYSKGFGLNSANLSLSKILQEFERGFMRYSVASDREGKIVVNDVPFPAYAINRYFPKFKGYTRCSPCSLVSLMERISKSDYNRKTTFDDPFKIVPSFGLCHESLYWSNEDLHKINVRLNNAFQRFCNDAPSCYPKTLDCYLQLHQKIWNCYNSSVLRLHLLNDDIPLYEKYDNLDFVLARERLRCFLVDNNPPLDEHEKLDYLDFVLPRELLLRPVTDLDTSKIKETDPNKFKSTISNTFRFESSFHEHIKHRNVSNAIYLASDSDCEL